MVRWAFCVVVRVFTLVWSEQCNLLTGLSTEMDNRLGYGLLHFVCSVFIFGVILPQICSAWTRIWSAWSVAFCLKILWNQGVDFVSDILSITGHDSLSSCKHGTLHIPWRCSLSSVLIDTSYYFIYWKVNVAAFFF